MVARLFTSVNADTHLARSTAESAAAALSTDARRTLPGVLEIPPPTASSLLHLAARAAICPIGNIAEELCLRGGLREPEREHEGHASPTFSPCAAAPSCWPGRPRGRDAVL